MLYVRLLLENLYLLDLILNDWVLVVLLRWWLCGVVAVWRHQPQRRLNQTRVWVCVRVCARMVTIPVLLDGWGAQWAGVCAGVSDCVWGCGCLREDPFPWYCDRFVHSCQHRSWFWLRENRNRGILVSDSLCKYCMYLKWVKLIRSTHFFSQINWILSNLN